MNNKEYLSEEQYQKISKKLSIISKILLVVGGISILLFLYVFFTDIIDEHPQLTLLLMLGFLMLSIGLMLFFVSHTRQISAYMTQQQMPVAKEGIEKMAPTAGVVAKEITKGVKEGIKEEDK